MSRKLKLFGVSLVAVLAALTTMASAASATAFHFETATVDLTGEQPGSTTSIINFSTKQLTCDAVTLTGTSVGTTTASLRVHPQFTGSEVCTFGGIQVPVKTTGCDAVIGAETKEFEGFKHASFALQCEAAKLIVIELPSSCKLEFGSQSVYGVSFINEGIGAKRDVKAQITAQGLSYTAKGIGCPIVYGLTNGGKYNDMKYTAWWTVKAYETAEHGKQIGMWFE